MKTPLACLAVALCALALAALPAAASAATAPWELKNPIGPQQGFRENVFAVCALDGGTAWVAGAQNAVYYSHDGGASWEREVTGAPRETEWRAVQFADRKHGFLAALSGLIYATSDGGATWAPRTSAGPSLSDLDLAGPSRLWAVGAAGTVLASADAGATWQRFNAGGADLAAVDFTSSTRGVAVGACGAVLRSADGGATWRRARALSAADLTDVVMQSPLQGWAVGEQGLVLRTLDGGLTWQRQETPSGLGDCLAVDFASAGRGWVALSSGKLLGTADGGLTWELEGQSMGALPPLRALDAAPMEASASVMSGSGAKAAADSAAPTPYRAFAAGDGGTVVKYTELGTSSHTNSVWLVPQTTQASALALPSGMSFQLDSIQYTTNQPYDGWTTSTGSYTQSNSSGVTQTYSEFLITINAGRSGSSPPAQWFTSFCDGAEVGTEASISNPASPESLNFAFNGTLTANASYTIAFGQGNHSSTNNWWVGGPGFLIVTPMSNSNPSIATPDSAWLFNATASNIPTGSAAYVISMMPN